MKSFRLIVSGRVQGVAFRYYTRRQAKQLGLRGYVRNLPDGKVEIVAEGEAEAVDAMSAWARKGPPMARVSGVEVMEGDIGGGYVGFEVRQG